MGLETRGASWFLSHQGTPEAKGFLRAEMPLEHRPRPQTLLCSALLDIFPSPTTAPKHPSHTQAQVALGVPFPVAPLQHLLPGAKKTLQPPPTTTSRFMN